MHDDETDFDSEGGGHVPSRVRHIELMLRTIQADVKYLAAQMQAHITQTDPIIARTMVLELEVRDMKSKQASAEDYANKLRFFVITSVITAFLSLLVASYKGTH